MESALTFEVHGDPGIEWSALKVLAVLVPFVLPLTWRVEDLELAPGPTADRAERLLEDGTDGVGLLRAFALDPQVINGSLIGNDGDAARLKLVATDGTHWDVYGDELVLETIRQNIEGSRPLPL